MADRISIELGADAGPLTAGLAQANDAVQSSANQMGQIWQALSTQTTSSFKSVNEYIETSFAGIGTKASVTQSALKAANQAIASDFATLGQNMTSSWSAAQSAITSATRTGTSERTALDQAASALGLNNLAQTASRTILNNALSAFSGVFANLAPFLGPAAAGPAATAQASVAAAAGSIASAAGGWEVPEDTLAFVHKDEKILPARFSQGLETLVNGANAGTNNGDVHMHINAIDTQSGLAFINQNMKQIVSGLKREMRNFALSSS